MGNLLELTIYRKCIASGGGRSGHNIFMQLNNCIAMVSDSVVWQMTSSDSYCDDVDMRVEIDHNFCSQVRQYIWPLGVELARSPHCHDHSGLATVNTE